MERRPPPGPRRNCLKECHKEYCIITELEMAQRGDVTDGLVFAGASAARVKDVVTVRELMARLVDEWKAAMAGGAS